MADTIDCRWLCYQVLDGLGDARAAPLLEQLFADIQAHTIALAEPADRDRLIRSVPIYRETASAYHRSANEPPVVG